MSEPFDSKTIVSRLARRLPFIGKQVSDLEKRIQDLVEEREDLMLCGRATPKDEQISPDYAEGTPLDRLILDHFDANEVRILELGSRNVTGAGFRFEGLCKRENYVGFDVGKGENVDVVGDAHELSTHFPDRFFDVVYSAAVFEHLAMPWVVAEEIAQLLKPGGLVITLTHFSFAEHELPWHFFQFNKAALGCLFNRDLGFEEIECYHKNPMVGRFAYGSPEDRRGKLIGGLYCSTHHIARMTRQPDKDREGERFDWRGALDRVYEGTQYPGT